MKTTYQIDNEQQISKIINEKKSITKKIKDLECFEHDQFNQRHLRHVAKTTPKTGSMKILKFLVDRGLDPSDALDFAGNVQVTKDLISLGANPSSSSLFSKFSHGDQFGKMSSRKRENLLYIVTTRVMLGGNLPKVVQQFYDCGNGSLRHNDINLRSINNVMDILSDYGCGFDVEKCRQQYYNKCPFEIGYKFVERFHEFVKLAPFVMRLNRNMAGVQERSVKRIKVENECPISRFLDVSAPVEVVKNVVSFLGF